MRMWSPRSFLLCFLLAPTVGAAAAEAPPVVAAASMAVVIPVGDPPNVSPETLAVSRQLEAELRALGQQLLAEGVKVRLLAGEEAPAFSALDSAYRAARLKGSEGRYAEAAKEIGAIAEELEKTFGYEGVFPRWSRAMLHLARYEQLGGHPGEARSAIERVLRADLQATPDPDLFPPNFVKLFEEVLVEQRKQPRVSLEVTTGLPSALIFLEGREVGAGSTSVRLAPGKYRVRLVIGGIHLPVKLLSVTRDERLAIDSSIASALRLQPTTALAAPAAERFKLLGAVGQALAVDRLFSVAIEGNGPEKSVLVVVHDTRSGCPLDEARLRVASSGPPPGGLAAVAALLARGVPSPLVELGLLKRTRYPPRTAAEQMTCQMPLPSASRPSARPESTPPRTRRPGELVRCTSQLDCVDAGGVCFEGACRR